MTNATAMPMISGRWGTADLVPGEHGPGVLDLHSGVPGGLHRVLELGQRGVGHLADRSGPLHGAQADATVGGDLSGLGGSSSRGDVGHGVRCRDRLVDARCEGGIGDDATLGGSEGDLGLGAAKSGRFCCSCSTAR